MMLGDCVIGYGRAAAIFLARVGVRVVVVDRLAQRFPYGAPITLEQAKKNVAAGQAEHKVDGKTIGAAGVSGGSSEQDAFIAKASAASILKQSSLSRRGANRAPHAGGR